MCRWGLEGAVEHWRLEGAAPFDSIHDVKATEHHVVIMDLPFVTDPLGPKPAVRRGVQDFARLWIVSKSDLRRSAPGSAVPFRELSVPLMGGHLTLDYAEEGGHIHATIAHHPITDLGLGIEAGERAYASGEPIDTAWEGLFPFVAQPTNFARYVIDGEAGKVLDRRVAPMHDALWGGLLFTQDLHSDAARRGVRDVWLGSGGFEPGLVPERWWQTYAEVHDNVFVAPRDFPRGPLPGALVHVDLERLEVRETWPYADGALPHPVTFAPRVGAEGPGDGYLVVVVHRDDATAIEVFDAARVDAGPVAVATHPEFNPPLQLHSIWAPRRQGPRRSDYAVDAERDAWETLAHFHEHGGPATGIARAIYDAAG